MKKPKTFIAGEYERLTNSSNVPYHRLKMRTFLNIFNEFWPDNTWVVHHKDGNKLNNDTPNLQIMTMGEHISLHHKGQTYLKDIPKSNSHKLNSRLAKIGNTFTEFPGAYKSGEKYRSQLRIKNKTYNFGTYETPEIASCIATYFKYLILKGELYNQKTKDCN